MNKKLIRSKFIDLLEGRLSADETELILQEIESDPALKASFEQYKQLTGIEKIISEEKIELNENFTVKVMDRLESTRNQLFWSSIMKFLSSRQLASAGLATCAVALLIFKLTNSEVIQQFDLKRVQTSSDSDKFVHDNQALSGATKLKSHDEINQSAAGNQPVEKNDAKIQQATGSDNKLHEVRQNEVATSEAEEGNTAELKQALSPKPAGESSTEISLPKAPALKKNEPFFNDQRLDSVYSGAEIPAVASRSAEKYGQYSENQRIAVSTDPVSTFSIDVDTGSYTNARRFIRLGQLPPPDSVRTEEFLNYFNYNYPRQSKEPFAVYSEIAPSPLEPKKYLLKLAVKKKKLPEKIEANFMLVFHNQIHDIVFLFCLSLLL